jgi:hypothetical protein
VCSTGVGCVILAGAVAGAASGAASYGTGVALGDDEFSVSGLAKATAVGAALGAVTGGAAAGVGAASKAVLQRIGSAAAEDAATAGKAAVTAAKDAADSGASSAEGATAKAASCAVNSFAAATPVLLASGTTKAIGAVKVGDKVASVDTATGKKTASEVVATYRNIDTSFTDVTLTGHTKHGTAKRVLHTTSHHRIYDATQHRFRFAKDLPVGDQLATADTRTWTVAATRTHTGHRPMVDVTVDTTHTFYALAGNTPILVHNCGEDLVEGYNGALRDSASGQFAKNPATTPRVGSSTHGNSRASTAVTSLYRRIGADGGFKKWGITSSLRGRYSSTELGSDQLIEMTRGGRSDMLDLERWLVENDPGPMNLEPWAGTGNG